MNSVEEKKWIFNQKRQAQALKELFLCFLALSGHKITFTQSLEKHLFYSEINDFKYLME